MDRRRFHQLCKRNLDSGQSADAESVFELLINNYSSPERLYHNGQHIDDCLAWLDRYRQHSLDPDAVELAIWFHDACYSPEPLGHERRAAALFRSLAAGKMNEQRVEKISEMILLTDHQQDCADPDQALLLDIDLASFCRPWRDYLKDTALCRAEMKIMGEPDYCANQRRFLAQLQGRSPLYLHPVFRMDNQQNARDNIARLLTLLERRADRYCAGL